MDTCECSFCGFVWVQVLAREIERGREGGWGGERESERERCRYARTEDFGILGVEMTLILLVLIDVLDKVTSPCS